MPNGEAEDSLLSSSRSIQVLYDAIDRSMVRLYAAEIERRHHVVFQVETNQFEEIAEQSVLLRDTIVIFLTPQALENQAFVHGLLLLAHQFKTSKRQTMLVLLQPSEVPPALRAILRIEAFYLGFDLAFEALLRFLYRPMPAWLQLYCRPGQLRTPTGASWWSDDILVADEYYGHLVRIKGSETSVALAGLDEPYHVHLDRRILLVTNLGGNEIIHAQLKSGAVWNLDAVDTILHRKLKRPHGVFQGNDYSLIADTDNHRILWKRGHFLDNSSPWNEVSSMRPSFPAEFTEMMEGRGWSTPSITGCSILACRRSMFGL
jgi:hypothetical protein